MLGRNLDGVQINIVLIPELLIDKETFGFTGFHCQVVKDGVSRTVQIGNESAGEFGLSSSCVRCGIENDERGASERKEITYLHKLLDAIGRFLVLERRIVLLGVREQEWGRPPRRLGKFRGMIFLAPVGAKDAVVLGDSFGVDRIHTLNGVLEVENLVIDDRFVFHHNVRGGRDNGKHYCQC
jgi:hypothetical protein